MYLVLWIDVYCADGNSVVVVELIEAVASHRKG